MHSTIVEEEVIKVLMQNQKASDVKTNVSKKINEAKTDYPSATMGGKGKYTSNSVMLKRHLKATMKFDQTLDCFKHQWKNQNKW